MPAVRRLGVKLCACHKCASAVTDQLYQTGLNGSVEYSMFVLARPREGCGPLCVFDGIVNLLDYFLSPQPVIGNADGFRIWACLFTPSAKQEVWPTPQSRRTRLGVLPDGTVLTDDVLLINEISFDWQTEINKLERKYRVLLQHRKEKLSKIPPGVVLGVDVFLPDDTLLTGYVPDDWPEEKVRRAREFWTNRCSLLPILKENADGGQKE